MAPPTKPPTIKTQSIASAACTYQEKALPRAKSEVNGVESIRAGSVNRQPAKRRNSAGEESKMAGAPAAAPPCRTWSPGATAVDSENRWSSAAQPDCSRTRPSAASTTLRKSKAARPARSSRNQPDPTSGLVMISVLAASVTIARFLFDVLIRRPQGTTQVKTTASPSGMISQEPAAAGSNKVWPNVSCVGFPSCLTSAQPSIPIKMVNRSVRPRLAGRVNLKRSMAK